MFDNYGIKDVFYGLWRFKWIIAVVVIISTVLGYGYGVYNRNNATQGNYCASVTYLVTTKDAADKKDTKMFNDSKEFAQNLKNMLSADFCYNFVIDEMKKTYSEEEVAKIINAATKKPTVAALSEVATVNVLPDSSEVNLFVECKEEKAANDLLNAFKKYVSQEKNINNYCTIMELGGLTQQLAADSVMSPKSFAIVGFAGSLFLMIIAVFIVTLVRPTLNERGDIEQYEVPVIGDKKSIDFTVSALLKAVPDLKSVAVASVDCKTDKSVEALATAIKSALTEQGAGEVEVCAVPKATATLKAVQTVAKCDATLICTTRSYTKHSSFYNAVRLFNANGVAKDKILAIF